MGALFSGPPSPPQQSQQAPPPPPPIPPDPVPMPQPDPEAQKRENIRKMAAARSRVTTRSSTILGNDGDTLG